MKLTKYQHACLVITNDDTTIVIDPGVFTRDFIMPRKVHAVVITHEHPDHFDEKRVKEILTAHPKATLFAHETITVRFTNSATVAVKLNEIYSIGSVTLRFYGGSHALITPNTPVLPNFGVLINDSFYYPGDSFVAPEGKAVKILALPASAPWLKISESIEFLDQIKPSFVFPTHDGTLSDDGKSIVDRLLHAAVSGIGATYNRLDNSTVEL